MRKSNLRFSISKSRFDSRNILAKAFVKQGQPMVAHILRMIPSLGGQITPNWARITIRFLKQLNLIKRANGTKGVVLYLKTCSVLLQQVCAGYKISDIGPLGFRVGRSNSGLPSIIPSYHRKLITRGNTLVIKYWLTVFSLYRDIHFTGEFKVDTIIDPSTSSIDEKTALSFVRDFKLLVLKSKDISFSSASSSLFPILKSGPQSSREFMEFNTHVASVLRSLMMLCSDKYSHLLDSIRFIADYTSNDSLSELLGKLVVSLITKVRDYPVISTYLGKLSTKSEAAGKVRIFAMVDPWTQWALSPLHNKLFNLLRGFKTDGTFDQLKPLNRVPFGKVPIYSFDLSAATDRLPLFLQKGILSEFYSPEFAHHWANLLVNREYSIPSPRVLEMQGIKVRRAVHDQACTVPSSDLGKLGSSPLIKNLKAVRYSVGQPMGALSSWAMLALTHHYIVQYCAWITCVVPVGQFFDQYCVLGDDIVIWNKPVADQYLKFLDALGVKVGLAKSVISPKGVGLEFAKKTIIKGVDVSPIPFKEMSASHRNFASLRTYCEKYSLNFTQALRFLGYGYKVDQTKVKTRIVRLLKTALLVPRDGNELLSLFSLHFDYQSNFKLKFELERFLVKFVRTELTRMSKTAGVLKYDLVQYLTHLSVEAQFMGGTHEGKIDLAIKGDSLVRYIKDLTMIESRSKVLGSGEYHPLDPRLYQFPVFCQDFQDKARILFEFKEIMDLIQEDLLINPIPMVSVSPTFLENQRQLRKWTSWSSKFAKATNSSIWKNLTFKKLHKC